MNGSYKTMLAGIAMILGALGTAIGAIATGHPIDYTVTIGAIIAGIGLIFSKDFNVSNAPSPITVAQPVDK